ncbi:MAG: hypothetical protein ACOVT5_17735 [Armatimonadaceae bacterium]
MKLPSALPAYIASLLAGIVAGLLLLFVLDRLSAWLPWSAERKVPVLEAQVVTAKDEALVAKTQVDYTQEVASRAQAASDRIIIVENRANEAIREIEAAPDAGARRGALLGFLCESPLYAADPACPPT